MIRINNKISINDNEIDFKFIRASGPGGQNINKLSSAVQLRFDIKHSPSIPDKIRSRLILLAGNRVTNEGVIVIDARRFRSQHRNRLDAIERLCTLIRQAAIGRKTRVKTSPGSASVKRRLDSKTKQGKLKQLRRPVRDTDI